MERYLDHAALKRELTQATTKRVCGPKVLEGCRLYERSAINVNGTDLIYVNRQISAPSRLSARLALARFAPVAAAPS